MSAIAPPSQSWRRSEPKTIRPFLDAKEAGQALSDCALKLKPGDAFRLDEAVRISPSEIGRLEPVLKVVLDQNSLKELAEEERKALRCFVMAESRFVKRVEVIREIAIDQNQPLEIDLPVDLCRQVSKLIGDAVPPVLGYTAALAAILNTAQLSSVNKRRRET